MDERDWPQVGVRTGDTALILAGGEGTRLRLSTDLDVRSKPKLLVEICPDGKPIPMLDHVVNSVSASGMDRIAIVTAPSDDFGDAIERHVMSRADLRVRPTIIRERERRGTGMATCGALRCVYSDTVVVLPGDILFPFQALPPALLSHEKSGHSITWTITTHQDPQSQNFGRIICDAVRHRVLQALEGSPDPFPAGHGAGENVVMGTSAGPVIFSREPSLKLFSEYLARHSDDRGFDLYQEFLPWVISGKAPVGYYDVGEAVNDLGTPERLDRYRGWPHTRRPAAGQPARPTG
jgi:NDP-sugar pyrophosphorylase family protein